MLRAASQEGVRVQRLPDAALEIASHSPAFVLRVTVAKFTYASECWCYAGCHTGWESKRTSK